MEETIRQLVEAREKLGISQGEAARRAGVSRSWVCRLEAGKMPNPKTQQLYRYANALGFLVRVN